MDFAPLDIILSVIFGLVGIFYLYWGRHEHSFPFIICGLGLMAYTLVTTSTAQVIWFGVGIAVLPFILDTFF